MTQYLPDWPCTVAEMQVVGCPAMVCEEVVTLTPSARAMAADLSSLSTPNSAVGLKSALEAEQRARPLSVVHCTPPAFVVVFVPELPELPEFPEFPLLPVLPLLELEFGSQK